MMKRFGTHCLPCKQHAVCQAPFQRVLIESGVATTITCPTPDGSTRHAPKEASTKRSQNTFTPGPQGALARQDRWMLTTFGSAKLISNLKGAHHSKVLMVEDVTVVDRLAREVSEAASNPLPASARDVHNIPPCDFHEPIRAD
jgi:hypothetical protein